MSRQMIVRSLLPLSWLRRFALLVLLAPALTALFLLSGQVAAAQSAGATINVFCLDFGKQFPEGQTIKAQGLANDKIRTGLAYALSKGYVTSNPYQVQLAVWNLQDGQPFHDRLNQGTTIAQEIVTNAGGTPPSGTATAVGTLTLTGIHETSPQAAYGTAGVQGNVSTSGLPVGFLLPASAGNYQGLVGVVAQGTAPQAAAATTSTRTASATTTSTATTTTTSTATATTTATSTVASAATTSAMVSALPNSGGGGTGLRSAAWGMALLGLFALLLGAAMAAVRRSS